MKKALFGLALATTIGTASAMPTLNQTNPVHTTYNYNSAYYHGKNDAYQNVATTLFVVGVIVVAGIVAYELGEQNGSRWGLGENGVSYAF